jgi:hypothetical protein
MATACSIVFDRLNGDGNVGFVRQSLSAWMGGPVRSCACQRCQPMSFNEDNGHRADLSPRPLIVDHRHLLSGWL